MDGCRPGRTARRKCLDGGRNRDFSGVVSEDARKDRSARIQSSKSGYQRIAEGGVGVDVLELAVRGVEEEWQRAQERRAPTRVRPEMRPVEDDAKRFGNTPLACKELRRKGLQTQATCGWNCRGRRKCGRGNPDSNDHLNSFFKPGIWGTRGAMLRACCPLPRSECPPPRRASLRRLRRRLSALRALPARDETARQLEKVSKPTARSEPGGGFLSLRPLQKRSLGGTSRSSHHEPGTGSRIG